MANLRAGLIGIGMMGRHHARVLGSLEGVDLVGIMDPGGDKWNVAGGRPVFDTVEQLLELGLDYCM
ncbi:MAG: gfo/Idh/MocA family oxidoreductase, partial [Arachnia sp.]